MSRKLARPVALGVIRAGDESFVFEGRDDAKRSIWSEQG
jgi:hypothetical protein